MKPSIWDAFKQYLGDAAPGGVLNPEVTRQGLLDSAAIATTPVPLLGDVAGLLADANRYATDPSSRTPGNFALSGLGLLPFVPGMTATKKAAQIGDYGLSHRPMNVDGGAALLHEAEKVFGVDLWGPNALRFFGSGSNDKVEKEVIRMMKQARGNPNAKVKIYRGVPDGVNTINAGDWVSLHPEYAKEYGRVISMEVPASHVTSWPDSLAEFGYYPK